MAEFNLSREPELVESRERLQQLSEEGEQLTKSVEEKTKQLSKRFDFTLKHIVIAVSLISRGQNG